MSDEHSHRHSDSANEPQQNPEPDQNTDAYRGPNVDPYGQPYQQSHQGHYAQPNDARPQDPYTPGTPGQGGWVPPYSGSAGWGPGWQPPAQPPRHRRAIPLAMTAVLVVAGAAAGVGLGHQFWQSGSTPSAASSQNGGSGSNSGNNGNSGNSGNGFDQNPFGGIPGNQFGGNGGSNGSNGNGSNGSSEGSGGPSDVSAIAAKVSPALVDINSTFGYQNAQGAGTGIVLTSNGEVITNNHVINGATSISVTDVGNGKTYSAKVVGYDNSHDIAVLKLQNASGLTTAKIADSSKVAVGQGVVAIGNAGGSGGQPTSSGGSVTALNQSITANDDLDGTSEQLSGLIQVNADVQSGDSGGSLVNTSGKVIGIDTAASDQFSFQGSGGQGYAIPINDALAIAKKIENGQGTSTIHVGGTAFLGVSIGTDSSGNQGGGFGNGSTTQGAQVEGVLNNGPAAQAGLAQGDVITSLDGHSVTSGDEVSKLLVGHHPGDKVSIGWVDASGQSHTATVQLASGPPA